MTSLQYAVGILVCVCMLGLEIAQNGYGQAAPVLQRIVTQGQEKPDKGYTALRTAALNDETRGDYQTAIGDLTRAIAVAHSWVESSDAYKFRADAERRIGDVNGAMQDEANADYVALGWDASPALPDPPPLLCPETAAVAKTGAPYRTYSGCPLPRAQTAILRLIGLRARYVDGRPFFNLPPHGKSGSAAYIEKSTTLVLTPGRHSVLFILPAPMVCSMNPKLMAMDMCPKDAGVLYSAITVEAGKAYTATASGLAIGDWIPIIEATEKPKPISPSPTWSLPISQDSPQTSPHHVAIDEQHPNSDVYLQLYESAMKAGSTDVALTALKVSLALFPDDANRTRIENLAYRLVASLQKAEIASINTGSGFVPDPPIERKVEAPNLTPCTPVKILDAQLADLERASAEIADRPGNNEAEDLKAVLQRAQSYVEDYLSKLGSLIGREIYVQDAVWTRPFPKNQRQRTEADYALRQVGNTWVGVRDVNCVNGKAVKTKRQDFQTIFESAAADLPRAVERISDESAAYNISDFQRTFNQPNFALEVLYRINADHFEFQKAGETVIGGAPVWMINFREIDGPALVHYAGNGEPEFSNGTLWIEPDTGRVRKTEIDVPHPGYPPFRSRAIVSYQTNARLQMLVPATMDEHYDSDSGNRLDCHAEYFDFQRPEIQTHFDFGAPPPPPKPSGPPKERQ